MIQANTVITGDSLTVLRDMEADSVDMVITDPPYGIDYQSGRKEKASRLAKIANDKAPFIWWIYDAARVVKRGGGVLCFTRWDVQQVFIDALRLAGLTVKSVIVWDKKAHGMGDLKGSFAPRYEAIIFATKGRYELPGKRPDDLIACAKVGNQSLTHPNEKPVALLEQLIEATTIPGALILDPFAGSGRENRPAVHRDRDRRTIQQARGRQSRRAPSERRNNMSDKTTAALAAEQADAEAATTQEAELLPAATLDELEQVDLGTVAEGERAPFRITDDRCADWAIRKIADERSEYDRLKALADEQIAVINEKVAAARKRMENGTSYLTSCLADFFATVPHKETKTTEKYRLLSGTLTFKKGTTKTKLDETKLVPWLKANGYGELVKVEESTRWADLKKLLSYTGDIATLTETGEIVEGVTVYETPGIFTVDV